jgi:hypothetical protein
MAVDEHGSRWGVVEARNEIDEGGFSRAGRAYEREAGTRRDFQRDITEDFGSLGSVGVRVAE